jgi:hypothetical protein
MAHLARFIGATRARACCGVILLAGLPALPLPEVTQIDAGRTSLRGLPGVAVIAEQVSSEIRPYGLTEEWLAERVTSALRRDSIPLLTQTDALGRDRQPLLVVRVQTVRYPGRETFAWHLSLALHQKLALPGASGPPVLASTWEANASIGLTSAKMLRSSIGGSLADQVAEFVEAWRKQSLEE